MVTDIETLKEYFETGDTPTQEQFAELIDAFFHRNEGSLTDANFTVEEKAKLEILKQIWIDNGNNSVSINKKVGLGTTNPQASLDLINALNEDFLRLGKNASGDIFKVDKYGAVTINNYSGYYSTGRTALKVIGSGGNAPIITMYLGSTKLGDFYYGSSYKELALQSSGRDLRIGSTVGIWNRRPNGRDVFNFGNRNVYTYNSAGLKQDAKIGIDARSNLNEAITTVGSDRSRIRVLGNSSSGLMIEGGNTSSSYGAAPYANFHLLSGVFGRVKNTPIRFESNGDISLGGSLVPKNVTEAQKLTISLPKIGSIVYQTDATEGIYIYKSTGWTLIS